MKQNIRGAVVVVGVIAASLYGMRAEAAQGTSAQVAHRPRSRPSGVVRGTVKDPSGAVIPGAKVALTNASGQVLQQTETSTDGAYTFHGVAPGTYKITVTYSGLLQTSPAQVSVAVGHSASANLIMAVQVQKQELTVTGESTNQVNTEPANNATALVLKPEDLAALPEDPDDLQADLEALAGPAAGPGGTQFYIDGFTGGQMPPKSSIREIRINTNPFSAEFHNLGYGRIEIFTKPGTDRLHGSGYFNISDDIWNARNPFLAQSPPFRTEIFGGNVSGPISKHASFFIDAQRRNIDDNGVVTATIPGPNFLGTQQASDFYPTPQRRTRISPRVDYQIGANNTLSVRYSYVDNDHILAGIGGFDMPPNTTIGGILFPSTGYTSNGQYHEFRVVDTAVLNAKMINETHFEYGHYYQNSASQSTAPSLEVQSAFNSGGSGSSASGYPSSYDLDQEYEILNYSTLTWGPHTTKFGLRVHAEADDATALKGFNGSWQFNGGSFPLIGSDGLPVPGASPQQLSSIDQYLATVRLLNMGLSSSQVTDLGYGPSKYTITAGNPYIGVTQWQFGPFIQDDWRVSPNFTLSLGLRYEAQTNISDLSNWAPRFGFAWAPGGGKRRSKTVIRGGWGVFYDHFSNGYVEQAERQNGINQQVYTLDFSAGLPVGCGLTYNAAFSTAPPASALSGCGATSTSQVYQIDSHLRNPYLMQAAVGLEQQLFSHTTLSVNYLNSRGVHQLRLVDINAPYPIPGDLPPGTPTHVADILGLPVSPTNNRPFPGQGDIYQYQSNGIYKQNMVLINVNSNIGGWVTLFSRYSFGTAHTNTDGASTLTSDPYNFASDWGRAAQNIENNFFLGGSIMGPWGLRFSPFVIVHSGVPFNLTTGNDLFLQGKIGTSVRPALASTPGPFTIATPYGLLDPYPVVPEPGTSDYIPLNEGTGPTFMGINLRVSKTWGFGTTKFKGPSGGAHSGGGHYHGRGFGGFGVQGGHGFSSGTEHRYNLTLSISARNILNHTNLSTPIGVITSPKFLESNGITGGYSAESTSSENRRMDLQLRFTF